MVRLITLTEEQVGAILDWREDEIKQCLSRIIDKKIEKARKPSLYRRAVNYFNFVKNDLDEEYTFYCESMDRIMGE